MRLDFEHLLLILFVVLVAYGWLFLRDLFSCHGQNVNFSDPLTFHLRYKSCGSFVTMQKEKLGHENTRYMLHYIGSWKTSEVFQTAGSKLCV